jgi:hypothetical protein
VRRHALLIVAATALAAGPARAAQVGFHLGMVGGTNLVSDSIVDAIAVRPNLALAIGASAEIRVEQYLLGASLTVSRSNLVSHEQPSARTVTQLTVWNPSLYLRHPVRPWLSGDLRVGAVLYDPAVRQGTLFRDGTPTLVALGLGLRAERRLGTRVAVGVGLHYDVHRFSTSTLRAQGFDGHTIVHRVATLVSIRRLPDEAPASR